MERQGGRPSESRADPGPEELDRTIDALLAGRVGQAGDGQDVAGCALARVRALAGEPLPPQVRSRHLAAIRTHGSTTRGVPSRGATMRVPAFAQGLRRRIATVTAGVVSLVLVFGGSTVAVAQDAQPDDALYGIKRVSEQAWLVLPRGQDRAAEVQLALAQRRIGEARERPAFAEQLVQEGLENVENAAEQLPGTAIDNLARLLAQGEDALPATASPAARSALHRTCLRLAERRGLDGSRCGERRAEDASGRRGHPDRSDHRAPGRELGGDTRPGVGPEGRPEAETGPPPWSRGGGPGGQPDRGQPDRGRPDRGQPDGRVGPP